MCLCRTWCKNARKDSNIKVDTNHHSFVRNCYDGNPYPCRSLTHTKCKTKEFWRNARPKYFDAQPPLQAASHVPQPFAIHLYFLEIHLQFVDFTCSINLHWWGLDRNLRFHQYNLYGQTFGIRDRIQVDTSSNCLWTESVSFDQFLNQSWPLHSKPSQIWRWCHRFYDAIVPV